MCCENPADHVFVDVDAECQDDLLGNSLTAPSAITPFHFEDRVDQFFRRAFGTWPTDSFRGKQESVLSLDQHFMKMQQSRGFLRRWLTAKHALAASVECTNRR